MRATDLQRYFSPVIGNATTPHPAAAPDPVEMLAPVRNKGLIEIQRQAKAR
jgi:hypothetical protein